MCLLHYNKKEKKYKHLTYAERTISNEKVNSTLKWNLTIQTLIVEFNCSHDYNIPQMVLILKGVRYVVVFKG